MTGGSRAPRVTALVLNWCAEDDTAACLESLARSRDVDLTILLIDNASPDGSGDRLHARFPDVPYLQTGVNLGYAGGNNRGFEWALARGAEYVLVLNDDTVIEPDCIALLVRAAADTGAAVSAPQIVYFDDPSRVWYGGGRFSTMRAMGMHLRMDREIDRTAARGSVDFVCGCCFLIRADVLAAAGGFEESYFAYGEDTELSVRLARLGHRMTYEPRALVRHRIARRVVESPFQIRQRDRNRRRLVAKHYGAGRRAAFAFWYYPTRMIHLARYAARGDWPRSRAILEGAFGPLGSELAQKPVDRVAPLG